MKRSGIMMLLAALFISVSSFAATPSHMLSKVNTQAESIHRKHRKHVKKTKAPKKTRTPQIKTPGK